MVKVFRFRWFTFLPVIILTLVGYLVFSLSVSKQIDALQSDLNASTQHVVSLHEQIGYGGLIHNFKNYLIRGDQGYFTAAKANATRAMQEVEQIEASAVAQGLTTNLSQTRAMITTYEQNLDLIEAAYSRGDDPTRIDSQVAFDDSKALSEINTLLRELRVAIVSDLNQLQRTNMFQFASLIVVIMIIVLISLWSSRLAGHRYELQKTNAHLIRTLDESERANQALSEFAGVASHDLRSPIRHVRLYSDMIIEDIEDPKEVMEHVSRILAATERMDGLVQSLLQFAKTSNQEPQRSQVDTKQLAEDVLQTLAPLIQETQTIVEVGDLPIIEADRELLRITFTNLIDNAVKYRKSDTPAHVRITAVQSESRWKFSVADNGIGIEPQYSEKIFRPLQRLHGDKSSYNGVGIGLALVKSIIESHQGKIWLDPSHTSGTKFSFTL